MTRRQLLRGAEALEPRMMLAGDLNSLSANAFANNRADVNGDRYVSPIDAVLIANAIHSGVATRGEAVSAAAGDQVFLDVSRNGTVDVEDFDLVIARLSGADGQQSMLTSSISLTLEQPDDANETTGFIIRGHISPPGQYTLDGTVTAEYTPGFPVETDANGMFEVSSMFGDDGILSDVENLYMEVWLADDPSVSASDSTTVTIHNVDPELAIEFVNYPLGGPVWEVQGQVDEPCVAICGPDRQTVTIDWGDGTSTELAGIAPFVAFDPIPFHEYARTGGTYTITVTVEDDDGGDDGPEEKTFNMYRFDLDNDADNNGEINEADEPIEDIEPGAYVRLNTDDDNQNGFSDLTDAGPISGEDDLEEFKLEFVPAIRADVNNYIGWELTLSFDVTNTGGGQVWTTANKTGLIEFTDELPELQTYARTWVVGDSGDPIPTSLFLEASAAGTIRLRWDLWSPSFGLVDSDRVVFTAIENRRTILMTGYWPPTDIGVPGRPGMLWEFQDLQRSYNDSGYDVLAITPTFTAQLGTQSGTWMGDPWTAPYWGKGTGTLTVDYQKTSKDFWPLVEKWRPIAIMSFSRGNPDKSWELEQIAKNWGQDDWTTVLEYTSNAGNTIEEHWSKPFIGGSPEDPAPPSQGEDPMPGDPPDPTKGAGETRESNLPMGEIEAAIDMLFAATPEKLDAKVDTIDGSGEFVSNFMAYHVAWYREWWSATNADPSKAILFSGHTHVGMFVDSTDAAAAVRKQLEVLIETLPGA